MTDLDKLAEEMAREWALRTFPSKEAAVMIAQMLPELLTRSGHLAAAKSYERVAEWLEGGQGSEEIIYVLRSNAIVLRLWAAEERKAAER